MSATRREFFERLAAGAALTFVASTSIASAAKLSTIKAVAFDGFPIIDPRPVFARAEEIFPGRGMELSNLWRIKQFDYCWLRTLSGQYADFWQVTEDALRFAAGSLKLDLSAERRDSLMHAYLELTVWPDVPEVLARLKAKGIRIAFLSNFTAQMLDAALKNAKVSEFFEPHLSTDNVKAYKPDPRAYNMAPAAFGLPVKNILFAASAGWDAAGAKWFGYPTYWVNRMNLPSEELGVAADGMGKSLKDLAAFIEI